MLLEEDLRSLSPSFWRLLLHPGEIRTMGVVIYIVGQFRAFVRSPTICCLGIRLDEERGVHSVGILFIRVPGKECSYNA
jgi:hypothetical protein